MKFCTTLDTIRHYSTKELQGSKLLRFHNIIIGIHEDDIPSYNAPGRAFIENQKIKPEKEKKEAQNSAKSAGN